MPSKAAIEFGRARFNARLLLAAAARQPKTAADFPAHKAVCLHAALAMLVAAWEAYLERLLREVQFEISDSTQTRLSAVLALLTQITESEIKRFNTPNYSNSRELFIKHIGYDPINDWDWPGGGLSGIQSRNRLDEILQVRHSFAHGFPVPTDIHWVRSRNRPGVLNVAILQSVDKFIAHMIAVTDQGLKDHLKLVYGVIVKW